MSSLAINSSFVVSDVSWLDDEKELQLGAQKDAETLQDAQDLAEMCTDKGFDEGVAYLKEKWHLEKQSPPKAVQALITSPLYLAVWSAALGLDGLSYKDKDRPPAITEIPLRECVAATISSCVTIVTLLDGLTASAGVQRHVHAKQALQCGLTELTRAWANRADLNPLEAARIRAQCNELVKSALGMPGLGEVATQLEADAANALHAFIQFVGNVHLTSDIRGIAEQLSELLPDDPDVLLIRDQEGMDEFMARLGQRPLSQEVMNLIEDQKENFAEKEFWALEKTGFGLFTNVVSLGRSVFELMRFSDTRGFLLERRDAFKRAIEKLKGKAGSKVLTHLFDSVRYKIKSNIAALFGASTRLCNAVGGILIKSLAFAGISSGPAAAIIAPIVVGIYAIKNFVGAYYDRLARRNECEVTNSIKIASNDTSSDMKNAIKRELTEDLEALAGNMDGIKDFVEAMGHPELFEPFQERFEAATNKKAQFTELQALIDACMPTSDALMNQQMIKSGKAPLQLMGHWNQRTADAAKKNEKADAPTKTAQITAGTPSQAAQVKPKKAGPATLEEKFLRNPVDKVIAAMTGTYPGWHLYKADPEFIKAGARKYLVARQGDTAGVKKLLSIADALTENKELLRQFNPLKALIKGKTWQLSAKGQDLQQALESGDFKSLKARTLVAALTNNNQDEIASCRFDLGTSEHRELSDLLQDARGADTRPHLKTFVRALETCDGKQLLQVVQQMKKNPELAAKTLDTLKTALILSGRSPEQARQIGHALLNPASKASHADVSQALAIALGQQVHARIADPALRNDIIGVLEVTHQHGINNQGFAIFVRTDGPDPRWDLYAKDVIAGQLKLVDAPHWLLSSDMKQTLGTRPLGKNCEAALKEQLKIGMNPLFQGKPKQPISLLWPSSVIKGVSVADLRNSFKALTGVVPDADTNPQELKQAAALYAKWTRSPPSLANIEAIVRRRPTLFAHLALVWTLSPLDIRAAYKATAATTVDALKKTTNSKGFINGLLDLLEEPKQPAKAVPVSKPAGKDEPLKPENEQSGELNPSADDSTLSIPDESGNDAYGKDGRVKDIGKGPLAPRPYLSRNLQSLMSSGPSSALPRPDDDEDEIRFKKKKQHPDIESLLSRHVKMERSRAGSVDSIAENDGENEPTDAPDDDARANQPFAFVAPTTIEARLHRQLHPARRASAGHPG